MIQIYDKSKCSGCHSCFNICPKSCIEMKCDKEGFWYPEIDKDRCINCHLCEEVCPIIQFEESKNSAQAYACYNVDEHVRMESSSGGVFSTFASYIVTNNGIVYGAKFDEDFNVIHDKAETADDIREFRGSKYTQSKIGETFKQVKMYLDQGKLVYYSGTPCQIDGLLCYLKKPYENLICQDIICHGVSSPMVWNDYVLSMSERFGDKTKRINFRNKENGWDAYELNIIYENKEYKCFHGKDPYMSAFLTNLNLRPSCYDCHSKSIHRNSDITLADFWGIDEVEKDLNDNKGISLLLINTEKGQRLFNETKKNLVYRQVNLDKAIKNNSACYKSAELKKRKRDEFFKKYEKNKLEELVKTINKSSILWRVLRKIAYKMKFRKR